jgi:dTDP-glucose pyrophosphorylase/predicted transcriptional regulator
MTNINNIKLSINNTIIESLRIIDKGALQIGLVVDVNNKLIGTLTDGDIRRALINNFNLEDGIENITFRTPRTAKVSDSVNDIIKFALENKLHHIPVVDDNNILIDLKIIDDLIKDQIKSNKVILMVGGLGTRLKPLTNKTPKPMLEVGDKPILETIINQFSKSGFKNIILCVNYKSEMIKDYFKDGSEFGVEIEYIYENKRMGTAGALSLLQNKPKEPFFVMNGDLLTNINFSNLLDYHNANKSIATMGVREYEMQVPYGVVNTIGTEIKTIEEKPTLNFFVSGGVYVLDPICLEIIPNDKFYDMPTLFEQVIANKNKTITYPISDYWLDIGRLEDFKKANEEYDEVF